MAMSPTPEPEAPPQGRRRRGPLLLAAGVCVVALVAGGVYAAGRFTGAAPGQCTASLATAQRLKPFATGPVAAFLPATRPVDVGGLQFTAPDGKPVTLNSVGPGVKLLNLWATWCAPCRAEMPALDRLQAAAGGLDFQVVALNIDTQDDGRDGRFLDETGVKSLTRWSDRNLGVFNALKREGLAVGMPTTLLVDDKGCSLGVLHGPAEWDTAGARALIAAALGN